MTLGSCLWVDVSSDVGHLHDILLLGAIDYVVGVFPPSTDKTWNVLAWKSTLDEKFSIASAYELMVKPSWKSFDLKWSHICLWESIVSLNIRPSFFTVQLDSWIDYNINISMFICDIHWRFFSLTVVGLCWLGHLTSLRQSLPVLSLLPSIEPPDQWKPPNLGWVCLNSDVVVSSMDGKTVGHSNRSSGSDNSTTIRLVSDPLADNSSMRLVHAINSFNNRDWSLKFKWLPHEENMVVDYMSKLSSHSHFYMLQFDNASEQARTLLYMIEMVPILSFSIFC
ncbi:hypothetical protein V6N11_076124 [Hibiscus sabdariffa]|uniref:Uncharacterized protein n=1 Tax=Hibiscus sabdariffa TaxID=183260 RepID=A0ABR2Q5S8_9ROSI